MDETSFLCNEGKLKVLGSKVKPRHDKNFSDSRFSMIFLWVVSAAGVNGPVIFLEKGTRVHPRLRGTSLVTRYGLPEGSYVIPNKSAHMDDKTWAKVLKVVAPDIRKIKVIKVGYIFPIVLYISNLSISVPSNCLQMLFYLPKWWALTTYDGFKSHVDVSTMDIHRNIRIWWHVCTICDDVICTCICPFRQVKIYWDLRGQIFLSAITSLIFSSFKTSCCFWNR